MKPSFFRILIPVLLLSAGFSMQRAGAQGPQRNQAGVVEKLDSILPIKLIFDDESANSVTLDSLINKPTVLSFVYFDCPGICPALLSGLSDVLERTDLQLGKDFEVITVSFNPADNPEAAVKMKANYLRNKYRPFADHWHYLTGDSAEIHKLTDAAGFFYQQAGVDFIHPSCIIILSPEGKITRYLYGTTFLPFDLKMALVEAQKGQSRPTINRVLEYCFSYDPEGRRYTLQVTKISATIILFFAVLLLTILTLRSRRKRSKKQQS